MTRARNAPAATVVERTLCLALLACAPAYLYGFVPRGWIPHDEGMIGQAAERVLLGGMPHVAYEEPYTGGLTWVYATVFRLGGIELLNVRWLLFCGALIGLAIVFAILRRYLSPVPAALGTWLALVWSFPNYFAGLPSWWTLICALVCLWALMCHLETGRLRYVVVAGLAAGVSVLIKQTGIYLVVALLMSLSVGRSAPANEGGGARRGEALIRIALALGAVSLALFVLRTRLRAEEALYLLLPIVASSVALVWARTSRTVQPLIRPTPALAIAVVLTVLPVALFLGPYALEGRLGQALSGIFLLPQKRFTFAMASMAPAPMIVTGVVMALFMVVNPRGMTTRESQVLSIGRWTLGLSLAGLSLWYVPAYQFIWQSSRSLAALLPAVALWIFYARPMERSTRGSFLFMSSTMLAWASLVQFPYEAPIYFCYVTPLAVIAAVAAADAMGWLRRPGLLAWTVMALAFGVLSMNRGYVGNLGGFHVVQAFDRPLDLPRARLMVTRRDAAIYGRLMALLRLHLNGGELVAGPDTPEVYFLAGRFNRSGALFDFFSEASNMTETDQMRVWTRGDVVVINHRPEFSAVPSGWLLSQVRDAFRMSETVGHFEVRWK